MPFPCFMLMIRLLPLAPSSTKWYNPHRQSKRSPLGCCWYFRTSQLSRCNVSRCEKLVSLINSEIVISYLSLSEVAILFVINSVSLHISPRKWELKVFPRIGTLFRQLQMTFQWLVKGAILTLFPYNITSFKSERFRI